MSEHEDGTTRFESADGSYEVEVSIPDDRRHINGLLDAMDEADKEAHRAGRHDDEPRDDCPLCQEKTDGGAP